MEPDDEEEEAHPTIKVHHRAKGIRPKVSNESQLNYELITCYASAKEICRIGRRRRGSPFNQEPSSQSKQQKST